MNQQQKEYVNFIDSNIKNKGGAYGYLIKVLNLFPNLDPEEFETAAAEYDIYDVTNDKISIEEATKILKQYLVAQERKKRVLNKINTEKQKEVKNV